MFGLLTYLALLLTVVVGSVLRPPLALAGVICLFGLKQWAQSASPLLAQYPLLTNFAIGALTVVAVLRAAFRRGCLVCRFPPAETFTVALLLYAFLTLAWSLDVDAGLDMWASSAPYLVVVVLLSPLVIDDAQDLRAAFSALVVVGAALCFLAVVFGTWGARGLVVANTAPIGSIGDTGPVLAETNPLALAELGGAVVIAAGAFLVGRGRPLIRTIAILAVPFALAAIIRSGSRGELAALVPAFLVATAIAMRLRSFRSWAALSLLTLVIVGIGWWATSLVSVDKSRWFGSELAANDVEGRFEMAGVVLQAALEHPLAILIGLGNSSSFKLVGIYPHIAILEVLAEEGVVGLALYLTVLIYTGRSIVRTTRALADDPVQRGALGVLAGLFIYDLVLSWKQGSLLGTPSVFCYAIILGRLELLFAQAPAQRRAAPETAPVRAFPNLLS